MSGAKTSWIGGMNGSGSTVVCRSPQTPGSSESSTSGPGQQYHHQQQQLYGNYGPSSTSTTTSGTGRVLTISVVGWSGAEKGSTGGGVGKSCLCNRFVRPLQDEYRTDHISTLSQVDFGGRVVNNDHWLYWGERSVFAEDGAELTFRLLEQTEFVDDESFQPLKASSAGQRDPYAKRCSAVRLQSADKLMYICKEQLGIEHEYEQRPLPDGGRANVDGFLCVFDVGAGPQGSNAGPQGSQSSGISGKQAEFVSQILQNLIKTRKPVVLATTKNDESDDRLCRAAERMLQSRKEFKNYPVPLVECSAHTNVNVEAAFMLLAAMIDRQHGKGQGSGSGSGSLTSAGGGRTPKVQPYSEAARNRREVVDVAAAAYVQKLKSTMTTTNEDDHRGHRGIATWTQITRLLADDPDFVHFRELCGTAAAQRLFKQHAKEARQRYAQRRAQAQMARLPDVMPLVMPDLAMVRGREWRDVVRDLPMLPHFDEYFQPFPGPSKQQRERADDEDYDPYSPSAASMDDPRIPAELLCTPEAENYFRRHVTVLEADHERRALQDEFGRLIADCPQVTPGKPLSDVKIFFLGKECFESLPECDLQSIYDRYQTQLTERARRDLVELLLEQVEQFVRRSLLMSPGGGGGSKQQQAAGSGKEKAAAVVVGPPRTSPPSSLPGMGERDWRELHEKLQEDPRYRRLNRLHQARDALIGQYASFVQHPLRQHCPAFPRCADTLVQQLIDNRLPGPDRAEELAGTSPRKSQQGGGGGSGEERLSFPPLSSEGRTMNLLVLGGTDRVMLELPRDMFLRRAHHRTEEPAAPATTFKLDYRSVDSDDGWWSGRGGFRPNGLLCVFHSRRSLDYVRDSISRALASSSSSPTSPDLHRSPPRWSLRSLPVVLLLALDPSHLDDLPYLQQQGALMADRWQCAFIGLEPSSDDHGATATLATTAEGHHHHNRPPALFTGDQLTKAINYLLDTALRHDGPPPPQPAPGKVLRGEGHRPGPPDASVAVCMMCGDDYYPELILGPLLNSQPTAAAAGSGVDGSAAGSSSFLVDAFSPGRGAKVRYEMRPVSYHSELVRIAGRAYSQGYVLVYTARRRASLAHLCSLAHLIPEPIPILVVAVGEVTEFFSDPATNLLITEGNEIADRIGARFITISKAAEQQLSVFTSFLDEVWSRVDAVRAAGFSSTANHHHQHHSEGIVSQYAPLKDFISGGGGGSDENRWYGGGPGGPGRPPPPPYGALGTASDGQSTSMTRSTYVCNHNNNGSRRIAGYSSPQTGSGTTAGQGHSTSARMYPRRGRLSESCLSVSGGGGGHTTDHSSSPSPSAPQPAPSLDQDMIATVGRNTSPGKPDWWDGGAAAVKCPAPPNQAEDRRQSSLNRSGSSAGTASAGSPGRTTDAEMSAAGAKKRPPYSNKKLGRINLVTDSISSRFTGGGGGGRKISTTAETATKAGPAFAAAAAVAAPLATPESIELGAEYITVKDALGGGGGVSGSCWPPGGSDYADDEQQYATVDSVLGPGFSSAAGIPAGGGGGDQHTTRTMESTSSGDSMSAGQPGSARQQQRAITGGSGAGPSIADRVRQLNAHLEAKVAAVAVCPPVPPYSSERMVTLTKQQRVPAVASASAAMVRRSASEESLLDPFMARRQNGHHHGCPTGAGGGGVRNHKRFVVRPARRSKTTTILRDQHQSQGQGHNDPNNGAEGRPPAAVGGGALLVRKVTSSFRFRRKKSTDLGTSTTHQCPPESRSMPQSPLLGTGAGAGGDWSPPSAASIDPNTRVFVLPPIQTSLMWNSNADGDAAAAAEEAPVGRKVSVPGRSPKKDSGAGSKEMRKASKEAKKSSATEAPSSKAAGFKKKLLSNQGQSQQQQQLVPPEADLGQLAASDRDPVPVYVRKCVEFVEAAGLQVEGIYRVPGNQAHVMLLEQRFLDDPNVQFHDLDLPVNAVATSLKNFFSSLSEPLVPYELFDELMDAMSARSPEDRLIRIGQTLRNRLPDPNRAVLRYFLNHLRNVADHFDTTAMDLRNLAKCWWPTLLRPQFDSFETMAQMTQRLEEFVQLLLQNPDLLTVQ